MSYADIDDIAAEISGLNFDSPTPAVEETSVESFLVQEFAFMNSLLNARYTVPIVELNSPISFEILKKIQTDIVVARVLTVINSSNSENVSVFKEEGEAKPYSGLVRSNKAKKELNRYSTGLAQLSDAQRKKSRISGNTRINGNSDNGC